MERRQTSERTRFTLREKKVANSRANPLMAHRTQHGKLIVGRAPYGWAWKNKTLVEAPKEMDSVRMIIAMKQRGDSIADILAWLRAKEIAPRSGKSWHRRQIYRVLAAEFNYP